jgi:hypothetical protein
MSVSNKKCRLKKVKIKRWLYKSVSAKYQRFKKNIIPNEKLTKTWMS